jgi:hypothetical protein
MLDGLDPTLVGAGDTVGLDPDLKAVRLLPP